MNLKKIIVSTLMAMFMLVVARSMALAIIQNAVFESQFGTVYPSGGTVSEAVAVADDEKFIQMDVDSSIVLKFPDSFQAMPDGTSAPDLQINTYDALYPASAEIFVSLDGGTWTSMGVHSDTGNIDLNLESFGPVKFVKIDQGKQYIDPAYQTLGFDLDAVVALNSGENNPITQVTCPAETTKSLVETKSVLSDGSTTTSNILTNGITYLIEASGTYVFAPGWLPSAGIADAAYSLRAPGSYNPMPTPQWTDGSVFPSPYTNWLELWIDGAAVNWGAYNWSHIYTTLVNGTGTTIGLSMLDDQYSDNSGNLTVKIYSCNPNQPPAGKDQCKKDGWKNFSNPSFKNQGDCVSYFQSNEKALGNKNK